MSITRFLAEASRFQGPDWQTWPFGPDDGDWLASVLRLLFVAVILGAVALYLRLLFGPKGWFRDKDLDREAREQKRRAALADLKRRREAGEVDEAEYLARKKELGE